MASVLIPFKVLVNKIGVCISQNKTLLRKQGTQLDGFVYKCKKQKLKVQNEVRVPKPAKISDLLANENNATKILM